MERVKRLVAPGSPGCLELAYVQTTDIAARSSGTARSVKAELTVSGVPPLLFRSRFWLREKDGRHLRLEVPPVAGLGADTIVELVSETGLR
jgi:hypothetical protein